MSVELHPGLTIEAFQATPEYRALMERVAVYYRQEPKLYYHEASVDYTVVFTEHQKRVSPACVADPKNARGLVGSGYAEPEWMQGKALHPLIFAWLVQITGETPKVDRHHSLYLYPCEPNEVPTGYGLLYESIELAFRDDIGLLPEVLDLARWVRNVYRRDIASGAMLRQRQRWLVRAGGVYNLHKAIVLGITDAEAHAVLDEILTGIRTEMAEVPQSEPSICQSFVDAGTRRDNEAIQKILEMPEDEQGSK